MVFEFLTIEFFNKNYTKIRFLIKIFMFVKLSAYKVYKVIKVINL